MDYRERRTTAEAVFRAAIVGHQATVWTAMPGIIDSFDAAKMTASIQPAMRGTQVAPDGTVSNPQLRFLLNVPVVFPAGGGFAVTLPLAKGDEVLVIFSARCIDAWWQSGGVQNPLDLRLHDLSDGFAIPGPFSQPRVLSGGVSTTALQIRLASGAAFLEMQPSGEIRAVTPLFRVEGNIEATGEITRGKGGGDQVTLGGHRHSQSPDARGDIQQPTAAPTAGT